jgi:hypothetical protein
LTIVDFLWYLSEEGQYVSAVALRTALDQVEFTLPFHFHSESREYGVLSEVSSVSRKLADVVRMVTTPIRTTAIFSSKPYTTLPTRSGDEGVHEGANENLVDERADKGGGDEGIDEGVDTSIAEGMHGVLDEDILTDGLGSVWP